MRKTDIAWMAGLFEGDGHIGICKRTRPDYKHGFHLYLQVTMTNNDENLLTPFLTFGGKIISVSKKHVSLRWYISSQKAVGFLKVIYPYLRGRKAVQTDLAIKFQSLIDSKEYLPVSEENLQERLKLYHQINGLNTKAIFR